VIVIGVILLAAAITYFTVKADRCRRSWV